ncbi:MAG: hypothetical protein FD180_2262 [Planctomycetota bacterium]|nr:MAG: hypothetical protein FD180_2262 [Planctomycetota bacterium]
MLRRQKPHVSGLLNAFLDTNDYGGADRVRGLTQVLMNHSARLNDHSSKAKQHISRMEAEVGFLSLIVAATLRTLADKGLVTTAEVLAKIEAVDAADGVKDGKISVDILRAILGIPRPAPRAEPVPKPVLRRNQ